MISFGGILHSLSRLVQLNTHLLFSGSKKETAREKPHQIKRVCNLLYQKLVLNALHLHIILLIAAYLTSCSGRRWWVGGTTQDGHVAVWRRRRRLWFKSRTKRNFKLLPPEHRRGCWREQNRLAGRLAGWLPKCNKVSTHRDTDDNNDTPLLCWDNDFTFRHLIAGRVVVVRL